MRFYKLKLDPVERLYLEYVAEACCGSADYINAPTHEHAAVMIGVSVEQVKQAVASLFKRGVIVMRPGVCSYDGSKMFDINVKHIEKW